jgi:hypothetical protein
MGEYYFKYVNVYVSGLVFIMIRLVNIIWGLVFNAMGNYLECDFNV